MAEILIPIAVAALYIGGSQVRKTGDDEKPLNPGQASRQRETNQRRREGYLDADLRRVAYARDDKYSISKRYRKPNLRRQLPQYDHSRAYGSYFDLDKLNGAAKEARLHFTREGMRISPQVHAFKNSIHSHRGIANEPTRFAAYPPFMRHALD